MTSHGPNCIACTDPAGLPALLARERARLAADAERAAQHLAGGEAARREYLQPGLTWRRIAEVGDLMQFEFGTANAILQGVMLSRARLDRVEAAHPMPGSALARERD